MTTWLEAVNALVSAASTQSDRAARVELVARARVRLQQTKDDVARAELIVVAQERELARIGGAK